MKLNLEEEGLKHAMFHLKKNSYNKEDWNQMKETHNQYNEFCVESNVS